MLNKPVNLFSQTSRRGASKALRGWVLLAVALTLPAAEYAVATTGSDSNPGTLAAPWATVQRAETMMQAGDICTIRGGTYREQVTPTNSGTATAPITFLSTTM